MDFVWILLGKSSSPVSKSALSIKALPLILTYCSHTLREFWNFRQFQQTSATAIVFSRSIKFIFCLFCIELLRNSWRPPNSNQQVFPQHFSWSKPPTCVSKTRWKHGKAYKIGTVCLLSNLCFHSRKPQFVKRVIFAWLVNLISRFIVSFTSSRITLSIACASFRSKWFMQ